MIASGKRFAVLLFSVITLGQTTASPIALWATSWWVNRASIMTLAAVNTAITATSEFVSRSVLASAADQPEDHFIVVENGAKTVHRQSIVNMIMTLIASILGGPIYFIRRRWHRFMFFISFGAMNSIVAQMGAHMIRDGVLTFTLGRFLFDFCYNGTIKFSMFEFARPIILRFRKSISGIGIVRVSQDFLTTIFRVGLLNWFGFK
jgi:hypothetical protein